MPLADLHLLALLSPHRKHPVLRAVAGAFGAAWLALALGLGAAPAHTAQAANPSHSGKSRRDAGTPYGDSARVRALAQTLAQSHELPPAWVRRQLQQARFLPGVPKLVLPPAVPTAKNWRAYRERFIEPQRIEAGTAFWQRHREALTRAEQQYGVPAELVVGIVGVETFYGQHMGNHRVLDTLTTLTLDFPAAHPRATERQLFFQNELGQFLRLVRQQSLAIDTVRGSFAGAMGWPQFMPSSVNRFAVDFDGDGHIDLRQSPVDAIGSVAHYLRAFGWQPGMPTHYPVRFDESRLDKATLLAPDILPTFSVTAFQDKGALLDGDALRHSGPLALVELFNGDAPPSYVAGTDNFYVVTRYNWSSYYALAVIELGQAIKARMQAAAPAPTAHARSPAGRGD